MVSATLGAARTRYISVAYFNVQVYLLRLGGDRDMNLRVPCVLYNLVGEPDQLFLKLNEASIVLLGTSASAPLYRAPLTCPLQSIGLLYMIIVPPNVRL